MCTDLPTAAAQLCEPDDFSCWDGADTDWYGLTSALPTLQFDSGYVGVPNVAEVRVEAGIDSNVAVDMRGAVQARWPSGLTLSVTPESGESAEISLDFSLDVTVTGRFFGQTLELPLVPESLSLRDWDVFEPSLEEGRRTVRVSDAFGPFRIVNLGASALYDLLAFAGVPIPGGDFLPEGALQVGLLVTVAGSYTQLAYAVGDGVEITEQGEAVTIPVPPEGFGSELDIDVRPQGLFDVDVTVTLLPRLVFGFFGINLLDYTLPIELASLPLSDEVVELEGDVQRFPLPDVSLPSAYVDFGDVQIGESRLESLSFRNEGKSILVVDLASISAPFRADDQEVLVRPGGSATVTVTFTPEDNAPASGMLVLTTNDPDTPTIAVEVLANGAVPATTGDMGVATADGGVEPATTSGSGCAVARHGASRAPAALVLLGVFGVLFRRRRRFE